MLQIVVVHAASATVPLMIQRISDQRYLHFDKFVWVGMVVLVLMRLVWLHGLPVNSDEPQHLHVVWAWTRGLLPYRDVFDNHTPLFHFLFAPVLMLVGETPNVLTWMRLAMLPLALSILWCTWCLGTRVWGRRVGFWATCLTAVHPSFFQLSGQFRTDVLWAALWLVSWTVALSGKFSPRRAVCCGVLVGAAMMVSLKTSLLLVSVVVGGAILLLARGVRPTLPQWREALLHTLAFAGGFAVLPASVLAFFAGQGALDDLWYCTVQHNVVPNLGHGTHSVRNALLALLVLVSVGWLARRVMHHGETVTHNMRGAILILSAVVYLILMYGLWPLFTRQNLLPVWPLVMLGVVALVTRRQTRVDWRSLLLSTTLLAEFSLLLVQHPPWRHSDEWFRDELRTVLTLTSEHDYVMDAKGSSIFRQRPWYYVLENITRARLGLGLIPDDLPQHLTETETKLIVFERLQGADLAFAEANYLRVCGRVGVVGKRFIGLKAGETMEFDLPIAARYVLVARDAPTVAVHVDGRFYEQASVLSAGRHRITASHDGDYALFWSKALALDLTPFQTKIRCEERDDDGFDRHWQTG